MAIISIKVNTDYNMLPALTALLPMASSLLPSLTSMLNPQKPTAQPRPVDRSRLIALQNQIAQRKQAIEAQKMQLQMKNAMAQKAGTVSTSMSRSIPTLQEPKEDKTLLYVGGGVLALGAIYFLTKGKK